MQSSAHTPVYIDLFAGCGGISLGLYNAGWRGLFAIENSSMAFRTLKHNLIDKKNHFDWPEWLPMSEHDIIDVLKNYEPELKELRGKVDLVTGGPPCQGFSLAGRRNKNDKRNKLVKSYVEFVDLVKPRMLFFENVKGFTIRFKNQSAKGKAYSEYVEKELAAIGYSVKNEIVDFSEFGIPQRRKRFILVGMLDEDPEQYFRRITEVRKTFLESKGLSEKISLYEALSDLERKHGEISSKGSRFKEGMYGGEESPYQKWMRRQTSGELPDSHRFARHRKKTVERWTYILKNCPRDVALSEDWKDKLGLKKKSITPLDCKSSCPTLTTLPDDYIHYSEPRILTVREYARTQSFADWYEFKDKYTTGGKRRKAEVPRYTQVGNAVPPLFTELSGIVLEMIRDESTAPIQN